MVVLVKYALCMCSKFTILLFEGLFGGLRGPFINLVYTFIHYIKKGDHFTLIVDKRTSAHPIIVFMEYCRQFK